MVAAHYRNYAEWKVNSLENFSTYYGVGLHFLEFFFG